MRAQQRACAVWGVLSCCLERVLRSFDAAGALVVAGGLVAVSSVSTDFELLSVPSAWWSVFADVGAHVGACCNSPSSNTHQWCHEICSSEPTRAALDPVRQRRPRHTAPRRRAAGAL